MKTYDIVGVHALSDNYIWLLIKNHQVVVVDPGCAETVRQVLADRQLMLAGIMITHRHLDHVAGVVDLISEYSVPVYGPQHAEMPWITHPVLGGDTLALGEGWPSFQVLALPGHTLEHVVYYSPGVLFCGDVLFSCGCGRLFEGDGEDLFYAMSIVRNLPPETRIYCAHEYTLANVIFARYVDPDNVALQQRHQSVLSLHALHQATVPSTLADERETNPFLRWDQPAIRQAVAQFLEAEQSTLLSHAHILLALREMKDKFRLPVMRRDKR